MGDKKSWAPLQSLHTAFRGTKQPPWGPLGDWVDVVTDASSAKSARTPSSLSSQPHPHQHVLISISLADSLHGF